jgi:heme exporter protein A
LSAIEISLLEKHFGRVRALDRVSATIPEGSATLISGPNGAGKSTLLRILASLTRPTRGTVRVLGVNPFSREAVLHRGRVGYLGQDAALYGELTVQENLEFCANLYGVEPQRIRVLIQDMELEPVARQRVRTLSLGYRRRVGLARARLTDPPLLLLDEPWNGLDAEASQRLTDLLQRHREAGRTALVAAHSPATTAGLFDAVLRLEAGRLAGLER